MPSSHRRPEPPPTFFLDRGLGRFHVADALRSLGLMVVILGDHYPDDGRTVPDPVWISEASERAWVALTKDLNILRDHRAELATSTLRVFALTNANLTGPQMAERVTANINRILQRARKAGPYVYVIHPKRLERRWPS
jgi:hypothetical protein